MYFQQNIQIINGKGHFFYRKKTETLSWYVPTNITIKVDLWQSDYQNQALSENIWSLRHEKKMKDKLSPLHKKNSQTSSEKERLPPEEKSVIALAKSKS